MVIDYTKQIENFRDYKKARENVTLVIKYLNGLKNNESSIEVNNDCVRMLMETLKNMSVLYIQESKLSEENAELRYKNHYLQSELDKTKKQLEIIINK